MAACVHCGVNMTTNERSVSKRGTAAALHNDCAHMEDLLFWVQQGNFDPSFVAQLNNEKARFSLKRAGSAAQWP
jgi:hypothetical protein